METTGAVRRHARHKIITLALIVAAVLAMAGCQYGYPHACDNHGGERWYSKGIHTCNDGTIVGDAWLALHHKEAAP